MLEVVLDQRLKDLLLVHRIVDASITLRRNRQLEVAGSSHTIPGRGGKGPASHSRRCRARNLSE